MAARSRSTPKLIPRLGDRLRDLEGIDIRPSSEAELATRRPTGQELFDSLSPDEQDEMLGAEAAQQVRDGDASLADFVKEEGGFIVQRPVSDL